LREDAIKKGGASISYLFVNDAAIVVAKAEKTVIALRVDVGRE
jgi:hypothetical protein